MPLVPKINTATRKAHENDAPEPMVELRCKNCGKPTGKQVRQAVATKSRAICGKCYYALGMKPQQPKNQKVSTMNTHDRFILKNLGIGR
jgi:hypothetical protein